MHRNFGVARRERRDVKSVIMKQVVPAAILMHRTDSFFFLLFPNG
jgi:hypothetical protein